MAKSEPKYRNFTFLMYGDIDDVTATLKEELIPMWIGQHNRDTNIGDDGNDEDKKEHHHVVMMFDSARTIPKAEEVVERVGGIRPPQDHKFVVQNLRTIARYLGHMDNPEKHQYHMDADWSVIEIGGAPAWKETVDSSADKRRERLEMTKDIIDYARKSGINNFSQMCNHCSDNNLDDWLSLLMWENSFGFVHYFKNTTYMDGYKSAREIADTDTEAVLDILNNRKHRKEN